MEDETAPLSGHGSAPEAATLREELLLAEVESRERRIAELRAELAEVDRELEWYRNRRNVEAAAGVPAWAPWVLRRALRATRVVLERIEALVPTADSYRVAYMHVEAVLDDIRRNDFAKFGRQALLDRAEDSLLCLLDVLPEPDLIERLQCSAADALEDIDRASLDANAGVLRIGASRHRSPRNR